MFGNPVKYSDFYREPIPENPLDLVSHLPKKEVVAIISLINSQLKPVDQTYFNDSREKQFECLERLFLEESNPQKSIELRRVGSTFDRLSENYFLFTRVTCLYALQMIFSSNEFVNTTQSQYQPNDRENILKFLLVSNEKLLLFDSMYDSEDSTKLGEDFFEFFMFKELPHNQYYTSYNPINGFYKSYVLFKSLNEDNFFKEHLQSFLNDNFGVQEFEMYFKFIMANYFQSYDVKLGLNYLNVPLEEKEAITILDKISERNNFELPNEDDLNILDFLNLKKSPVYINEDFVEEDKFKTYVVLDNIFLIEKMYSLFINDFWFDYLKPNEICNRTDWGNFIGSIFYEPFLETIFEESFSDRTDYVLKSTDDLKFKLNGKSEVEYADFYIRYKQKIILIEAKSNYLPVVNGYKTVKKVEDYKALKLNKFYKDYGLLQLANKTIKLFHEYKSRLGDEGLNVNRKVHLYPVLVVNDPIFSSGYALFALRDKFLDLLKQEGINVKAKEHLIRPLLIIHVSELQEIEQSLKDKKIDLFNLINTQLDMVNKKGIHISRYDLALRTLSHAIDKKVKNQDKIAKRIKDLSWLK